MTTWHDIPCDTCHDPMFATSMSATCRQCMDLADAVTALNLYNNARTDNKKKETS